MTTTTVPTTSTFSAPDISCGGCAKAIRRSLGALNGVHDVSVDVDSKTITLSQEGVADPQTILAALDRAGFPATQIESPDTGLKAQGASGSCCKA